MKGILTHEDATLALKTGCKGIIVSNHGGRQLDSVPATIEALPEIVNAVGSQLDVMIDGGIRNGIKEIKFPPRITVTNLAIENKVPMSSKHLQWELKLYLLVVQSYMV